MNNFNLSECTNNNIGFSFYHTIISGKNTKSDPPHTHRDLFEIFLLINGNVDYVVEGQRFHVNPYDIVIVNNNEIHKSIIKNDTPCEFILLSVNLDFFIKNECDDFDEMIFKRKTGTNNTIPSQTVIKEGIWDIYTRLEKYISEKPVCFTVAKSVIIELLYNINKQVQKSDEIIYSEKDVKNYIQFINDNITQDLTLEMIANHFYISKQYLCKIFKQKTGLTVKKYISYKRIVLVRELYSSGMSITEACTRAGFNGYSNFYRTFFNLMHESPRQNLSNIHFHFENTNSDNNSEFFSNQSE